MDPLETLRADVREAMRAHGFRRAGYRMQRDIGELIQVIDVQRHPKSLPGRPEVTVNLGVYAKNVPRRFFEPTKQPHVADCHWRERIGLLMPSRRDTWWEVTDSAAQAVGGQIVDALEAYGLPAFEKVDSLEKLARLWRSGRYTGLTERENYWYWEQVRDQFPHLETEQPNEHER